MSDAVDVMNRWTSGRNPDGTMPIPLMRALAIAADEYVALLAKLEAEIATLRSRAEAMEAVVEAATKIRDYFGWVRGAMGGVMGPLYDLAYRLIDSLDALAKLDGGDHA